jgi:hypothetical protein
MSSAPAARGAAGARTPPTPAGRLATSIDKPGRPFSWLTINIFPFSYKTTGNVPVSLAVSVSQSHISGYSITQKEKLRLHSAALAI